MMTYQNIKAVTALYELSVPVYVPLLIGATGGIAGYIMMPFAGVIEQITATMLGSFTISNIVITPKIGSVTVANGIITLPFTNSAPGKYSSAIPTANNAFNSGDIICFGLTGGVGAVSGNIVMKIKLS